MLQFFTLVTLGLVALCAVLAWVFAFRYSRVNWYSTPEGRQLMQTNVLLALLFSLTLLFQALHPKPPVGITLSIALFGWAAYLLGNWIRLQRNAQRDRDHQPNDIGDTH